MSGEGKAAGRSCVCVPPECGRRSAAIPSAVCRLSPRRWVLALLVVLAAAAPSSAPRPAAACPVRRRAASGGACDCTRGRVKILHVTRHGGLEVEVRATLRHLCCVDVQTFAFHDGVNVDGEEAGDDGETRERGRR